MTKERIIVAATVTNGEKADGKELPELVRKSREPVEVIIMETRNQTLILELEQER